MFPKIQQALLRRGYFPKELPPAFTTDDFGLYSHEIIVDWRANGVFSEESERSRVPHTRKHRRHSFNFNLMPTEAETISMPKRGYERRLLHVTHPVPQALLARELSQHWKSVQKWLSRQIFSADDINISLQYERSIKGINFNLHRNKKAFLAATSDWIVKTDISRFYPSIYTHSIAWAAYGKEKVKRNVNLYRGSLADRLDSLIRLCNRNQTIGIPIGPETSRIIAEIISSAIDYQFHNSFPEITLRNIDRLQDDWMIGVDTLDQAERVLYKLSTIYQSFGLDINGSKTSIERIISGKQSLWVSEISAFLSHGNYPLRGIRLREFFNLCLRLQSDHRDEPVISYALAVIEGRVIASSDVASIESFLLEAAVVAPNSMERICRIILDIRHTTKKASTKRIGDRFLRLIETALEKGHTYEVIWKLYALRGLGRPVDLRRIFELTEELSSSVIALLLLDMKKKGIAVGRVPTGEWEKKISEDTVLSDWTWLLAYEGYRQGWLTDKHGLMSKGFFEPMARRKVVFFDPDRNILTAQSYIRRRALVRRREQLETERLMTMLRGIQWDTASGF